MGFISIRWYRGISNRAIFAAPRDIQYHAPTHISHVHCPTAHWIHRAIIIARTVIRPRLKGPNRGHWRQDAIAWLRHPTHTITLHNAALFDLYFADSYPPYSNRRWRRRRQRRGELCGWPAPHVIHTLASVSCPINRGVQIVKVWSASVTEFDQRSKFSDDSNTQSWVCSEATSECCPLLIVQTCMM